MPLQFPTAKVNDSWGDCHLFDGKFCMIVGEVGYCLGTVLHDEHAHREPEACTSEKTGDRLLPSLMCSNVSSLQKPVWTESCIRQ